MTKKDLTWKTHEPTQEYLEKHLPKNFKAYDSKIEQFGGRIANLMANQHLAGVENLERYNFSSPDNIIDAFKKGHFLIGYALVISWGNMNRVNHRNFAAGNEKITKTLEGVNKLITLNDDSFSKSWDLLQFNLGISNVMISKTLHFMYRANGFSDNPPVPIDNKVIIKKVWPAIFTEIDPSKKSIYRWDDGKAGYLCYMTFINFLKVNFYKNWSTTEIECAVFNNFEN